MVWGGGRQRYRGHWSNGSLNGHGVYVWQSTTAQNHAQVYILVYTMNEEFVCTVEPLIRDPLR